MTFPLLSFPLLWMRKENVVTLVANHTQAVTIELADK